MRAYYSIFATTAALLLTGCGQADRDRRPSAGDWLAAPPEFRIGIFTGATPVSVADPSPHPDNPVLTGADVTDVPAAFVADPFLVRGDGQWYLFFEVFNAATSQGDIGLATSEDGQRWKYERIVLDEPFHMSYPYVFRWQDAYYMVPETSYAESVRLYRADPFPYRWSCVTNLVNVGLHDPSILEHDGRWWLFASHRTNTVLQLYMADRLTGPWQKHPASPIVNGDANIARPGGRVVRWGEKLLRIAQDCDPTYGNAVRAFEILTLTPERYAEREVAPSPVLAAGGPWWTTRGMHQLDAHLVAPGSWIAAVDGLGGAAPDHLVSVTFEDGTMLAGYTIRPARPRAGEHLLLRLFWHNMPKPSRRLAVMVHFRKDADRFQGDFELPLDRTWYEEEVIAVPADARPGPWRLWVAIYSPDTGVRLRAHSRYHQQKDAVCLPQPMEVAPPEREGR
jgi:hypothetical protein